MNEARRLGTCTDTLTRREKNDSLALSSTATTYVGFSVLPTLCKKGCYTHLYNIVIQVVIQYLLYTLRIIVYNCV